LRTSIQLVLDDLEALGRAGNKKVREKIKLSKIIDSNGGRYRGEGMDSVMFGVYTKIQFTSMVASRRGMGSQITLSPPPAARLKTAKDRAAFWERGSGKRLMQGGLVALIWKVGDSTSIYLATIDTKATDLALSSKKNQDTITINLVFFDPEVELRILQILKRRELDSGSTRFLIEAPVMFEAIRPFLEGLRAEPETIPFKQYIVHHPRDELRKMKVEAPAYAKDPAFRFQLASLFDHTAGITDLQLSVNDANSVLQARRLLKAHSRLDPSQADAVVDSLTREVALIQGPPGTGKVFFLSARYTFSNVSPRVTRVLNFCAFFSPIKLDQFYLSLSPITPLTTSCRPFWRRRLHPKLSDWVGGLRIQTLLNSVLSR
jgi:hypothetical protein